MNKLHLSEAEIDLSALDPVEAHVTLDAMPQHWMREQSASRKIAELTLNANQLTSLSAMIAYAASKSGKSEYRIERGLSDYFNVPNAKFLSADDFDAAIRYLADIITG